MAAKQQSFEIVWPGLSARLKRVLQSRRVPEECVDDVVQETGLRLLRNWSTVDQSTIWSFTLTISGNIIKDDMRRRVRDEKFVESLPANSYVDIEERAMARVELGKTHRAIESLSAVQRTALLTEVYGFESSTESSAGAAKMSRLRARRRLRQVLGRASGLVALGGHRLRRIMFGDPRNGLTESASQTVAAALLIAAGVDLVMLGGGLFSGRNPGEFGSMAIGPSNVSIRATRTGSVGEVTQRPSDSIWSSGWVQGRVGTSGGSGSTEVLRHNQSVGTNGAKGSFQSTLLGQRASVDVQAERDRDRCQGDTGVIVTPNLCVGSMSFEAVANHNGKSYGVRATTQGDVGVESPYGLNTGT